MAAGPSSPPLTINYPDPWIHLRGLCSSGPGQTAVLMLREQVGAGTDPAWIRDNTAPSVLSSAPLGATAI